MAKHSRRHSSKRASRGLFGYIYNPIDQTLRAADDVTRVGANTIRNIASKGIRGVSRVGRKVTSRANKAVRGLLMTRKGSKASRRASRKANRR